MNDRLKIERVTNDTFYSSELLLKEQFRYRSRTEMLLFFVFTI